MMKFVLRAFAHMVFYVFVLAIVKLADPNMGEALASAFVGAWIAQAVIWKRKCKILENRVEDLIDIQKMLDREYDKSVPFEPDANWWKGQRR